MDIPILLFASIHPENLGIFALDTPLETALELRYVGQSQMSGHHSKALDLLFHLQYWDRISCKNWRCETPKHGNIHPAFWGTNSASSGSRSSWTIDRIKPAFSGNWDTRKTSLISKNQPPIPTGSAVRGKSRFACNILYMIIWCRDTVSFNLWMCHSTDIG